MTLSTFFKTATLYCVGIATGFFLLFAVAVFTVGNYVRDFAQLSAAFAIGFLALFGGPYSVASRFPNETRSMSIVAATCIILFAAAIWVRKVAWLGKGLLMFSILIWFGVAFLSLLVD